MHRAVIATAGTVLGLAALLSYRSSGTVTAQKIALGNGPSSGPAASTTTTAPAGSPGATGTTGTNGTTGSSGATTTVPPATSSPASSASHVYVGQQVPYFYGQIEVAVTVKGGKLVNVTVPQDQATDPHSASINQQAVPMLEQSALAAKSLNFYAVSGATYTSDAFAQSFQSALQKAGL